MITGDGSHTILDASRQVTYHSIHGAIIESRHVFIRHGLEHLAIRNSHISVLEVGFGTGLNAFLSYLFAREHDDLSVQYTGIEKFPLAAEIVAQLNYSTQLDAQQYQYIFQRMHVEGEFRSERFHFNLFVGDVLDFIPLIPYDLIYFDAFAPGAQPEMWEAQVFKKLMTCLTPGGILVTYCAQGKFKRTLRSLGFQLESLPGPPGKREMVRAGLGLS